MFLSKEECETQSGTYGCRDKEVNMLNENIEAAFWIRRDKMRMIERFRRCDLSEINANYHEGSCSRFEWITFCFNRNITNYVELV